MDSVEFTIPQGEVVGLLGPNGAGKTTTIRMITGYLPPTEGTVTVAGYDVTRDSLSVRRQIGYLPESAPTYSEMRVSEFLGFRARLFGVTRHERREAIERVLERCWLQSVRRRPIHQLSKGFRQRVGLASALLHEPPVLILDEPTVGLDPAQIREARKLIRELAGQHTVILSSHILSEVELVCDRLIMMARGRIQADGTIDQLQAAAAREGRYFIETLTPKAADALASLPEVRRVERTALEGGWYRFVVTPSPNVGDLRDLIGRTLALAGAPLRELRRETPSLEHLFLGILDEAETARQGGDGGRPPTGTPVRSRSEEVMT
ncbi:MAG: ABC transporter ATP-binding protein [Planctomycetota bacterium]